MQAKLPYRQEIDEDFAALPALAGPLSEAYRADLAALRPALERLRGQFEDRSLPLLRLPAGQEDLPRLHSIAEDWRERFRGVVVLGTGGSSLGGRALAALAPAGRQPELCFLDNLDPWSVEALAADVADPAVGVLAISKSGSTAETLSQVLVAIEAVLAAAPSSPAALADRFLFVAEPGDSPLRRLAAEHEIPVLDHDPQVGGRYSVLSLVGLLPALLKGLDAAAVRDGARAVLDLALTAEAPGEVPPAAGAALSVAAMRAAGIGQTVLMPYLPGLELFAVWHRQLWAESLGKKGQGSTPIPALGPVDQHSQLQLYLDGPADKLFTLIEGRVEGLGPEIPTGDARALGLDYLAGRCVGDLVAAMQRATAESLRRHGRLVRQISVDRLDERCLGALFMHFMLETILAAHLLDVDPFDQPAVEDGKQLARRYLAESAAMAPEA